MPLSPEMVSGELPGVFSQAVIPARPGAAPQLTSPVALESQLVRGTLPAPVKALAIGYGLAGAGIAFARIQRRR